MRKSVCVCSVLLILLFFFVLAIQAASASENKINASSGQKMVTVPMQGYGNVTVREDMIVRDGDNITIVANKDAKEKGVITPKIEKLPKINYVVINTEHGSFKVADETYKNMGNKKVLQKYAEFIKLLDESQKATTLPIKSSNSLSIVNASVGQLPSEALDESQNIMSVPITSSNDLSNVDTSEGQMLLEATGDSQERVWYYRRNPNQQYPDLVYGRIEPSLYYNTGQSYTGSYHEREILLSSDGTLPGDVVEFISDHRNDPGLTDKRVVWVALYDQWDWRKMCPCHISKTSIV